jgi:hypothetical protein
MYVSRAIVIRLSLSGKAGQVKGGNETGLFVQDSDNEMEYPTTLYMYQTT